MKSCEKLFAVMSMIQSDKCLIAEVKKYPYIYDQKHEYYKDTKLKEETWIKVATAINVKAADAKSRWRNLRDRYVREKKLLVTEGPDVYKRHEMWPYLEDMSFLWGLIVHRKRINPDQQNGNSKYSTGDGTDSSDFEESKISPPSLTVSITEPLKKHTKPLKAFTKNVPPLIPKTLSYNWVQQSNNLVANGNARTENDVIEVNANPWECSMNEQSDSHNEECEDLSPTQSKLRRLLEYQNNQDDSDRNTPNSSCAYDYSINNRDKSPSECQNGFPPNINTFDEDELFCLSVAGSLKRFCSRTKAITKVKIQQILFEAEFQENEMSRKLQDEISLKFQENELVRRDIRS